MKLTLLPLDAGLPTHVGLLQAVYRAVPDYWRLYGLPGAAPGQAQRDLTDAAEAAGRTLLGIVLPAAVELPQRPAMVGVIDFRIRFPEPDQVTVGMVMVAESYQRQGIGRAAWALLEEWLSRSAGVLVASASVEQFNPGAVRFFTALGFAMTGAARRHRVGEAFVRLLAMEKKLSAG